MWLKSGTPFYGILDNIPDMFRGLSMAAFGNVGFPFYSYSITEYEGQSDMHSRRTHKIVSGAVDSLTNAAIAYGL